MAERRGTAGWRVKGLSSVLALVTVAAASVALTGQAVAAGTPTGGACGYYSNVGLFGGAPTRRGCGQTIPPGTTKSASPSVTLPAGGSATVLSATDSNGALAAYGPSTVFSGKDTDPNVPIPPSGRLKVTTIGTTKVKSTASVLNVGPTTFTADAVSSQCTATATAHTWSSTITNGVVATATDSNGNPTTTVAVPSPTPANYKIHGVITNVGDSFDIVLNEQIANGGGTFTVNAAHMKFLGPTAVGDLVIAQSRCGH